MRTLEKLLLAIVLVWSSCLSGQEMNDAKVVRILTYNILHGATTNGDFDLDQIAGVIRETNPDLVALQEVDFLTKRAKKYDLVTELGWRLKMAPVFGRAMPFDGGEYGEGILSRYSFLQTRNVSLPHAPASEPRTALEVTVQLPSGDTICLVGTHLDHLKDPSDRNAQAEAINRHFASNVHPTILAGDLNAQPGSRAIEILEKFWTASYDPARPEATFPSDRPRIKIDYIMYAPQHRWKVLETRVIANAEASDHCALLVVLELKE